MKRYVLDTINISTGDYEVHESSCSRLPPYIYQKDLGYHFKFADALKMAQTSHPTAQGCVHCNRACHSSVTQQ